MRLLLIFLYEFSGENNFQHKIFVGIFCRSKKGIEGNTNEGAEVGAKTEARREGSSQKAVHFHGEDQNQADEEFVRVLHFLRISEILRLSPSQQYPGRYEVEKETELSERPATNVYIRSMLKTQFLTVSEALAKHRDLQVKFLSFYTERTITIAKLIHH